MLGEISSQPYSVHYYENPSHYDSLGFGVGPLLLSNGLHPGQLASALGIALFHQVFVVQHLVLGRQQGGQFVVLDQGLGPRDVQLLRCCKGKEGNVLFNDALNTFYLRERRKCFI